MEECLVTYGIVSEVGLDGKGKTDASEATWVKSWAGDESWGELKGTGKTKSGKGSISDEEVEMKWKGKADSWKQHHVKWKLVWIEYHITCNLSCQ